MNPDSAHFAELPREEVEAKITALLLGELDPVEASALEAYVAREPELARLRAALLRTLELVREATTPARPPGAVSIPRHQLSPERRERLLARLRALRTASVEPAPAVKVEGVTFAENGWAAPTIFRLLLAACLVAVLGLATLWLGSEERDLGSSRLEMAGNQALGFHDRSLGNFRIVTNRGDAVPVPTTSAAGGWVVGTLEVGQTPTTPLTRGNSLQPMSKAPEAAGEVLGIALADADGLSVPSTPVIPTAPVRVEAPPLPEMRRRYGLAAEEPQVRMQVETMRRQPPGPQARSRTGSAGMAGVAGGAGALAAANPPAPAFDNAAGAAVERYSAAPTAAQPSAESRTALSERLLGWAARPVDSASLAPPPAVGDQAVPHEPGQVFFSAPALGRKIEARKGVEALAEAEHARGESKDKREAPETSGRSLAREAVAEVAGVAVTAVPGLGDVPTLGKLLAPTTSVDEMAGLAARGAVAAVAGRVPAAAPAQAATTAAAEPVPEVVAAENAFSTFSLNVSDVSLKLAAESLKAGNRPAPETIRSEEFINAFRYRDPEPVAGFPLAFAWERARHPFAQQRDLLRLAVRTAALGREAGRPLNLVLLLDNSGSMERADRVRIRREAVRVLSEQLKPEDRVSVVAFARTARLWVDGLSGDRSSELGERIGNLMPEGGTDLGEALRLGYEVALRHFLPEGGNRVVLLTDGAANLGDVEPASLQARVEENRRRGVALDCFGVGWEGYNDDLLEVLSRHGDGRYGFLNTVESAAGDFASQLAGALQVAAADVKVQVEFNPRRVRSWRQVGYTRHQLTQEQFRDNTVDAAEIGAAESGNALYVIAPEGRGDGPLATVRVRFRVPATGQFQEHAWVVPYVGTAPPLEQASPALRLAAVAGSFAEWLEDSPYAGDVQPDRLLALLNGVPAAFAPDPRPGELEWMIRQAQSLSGR